MAPSHPEKKTTSSLSTVVHMPVYSHRDLLFCHTFPPTLAHSTGLLARSGTWQAYHCLKAFALSVPSAGKSIHPAPSLGLCSSAPLQWGLRGVRGYPIWNGTLLRHFIAQTCSSPPPPICTYQAVTSSRFYSSCLSSPTKPCAGNDLGLFCFCLPSVPSTMPGTK